MPNFQLSHDVAVDMGTSNTRIYVKNKGIVINEASVLVLRANTRQSPVVAIGDSCEEFIGRANSEYRIVRPIRSGIIVDYENAQIMLHYFLTKAIGSRFYFKPRVVVTIPGLANAVQRQSVINVLGKIGVRQIHMVEQAYAAANAVSNEVKKAKATFVVDIGAGTTEVALISLEGMVASRSAQLGGDLIDEKIREHLDRHYGMEITDRIAEQIKYDLTDVREEENQDRIVVVRGRDKATSMPFTQDVKTSEICRAIHPVLMDIVGEIRQVLEMTPPELCRDIIKNGIILTGGSAQLPGLDTLIVDELGISVSVGREAEESTILGAGAMADHFEEISGRDQAGRQNG
ncbi:MAG: rod shape-determining protein [Clostridia bacterium]|nr:rod shape-determining protein [Clostridia bacterium]